MTTFLLGVICGSIVTTFVVRLALRRSTSTLSQRLIACTQEAARRGVDARLDTLSDAEIVSRIARGLEVDPGRVKEDR